MPWYIYSILTSLLSVGMILCTKHLGNKGFASKQITLFLIGFAFFEFLLVNAGTLNKIWESEQFWPFAAIMVGAGIFAVIGNWAYFTAIIKAPNPGFVGAITNSNLLLITILSVFIFGSSLNFIKLAGALIFVGGITTLVVEKKSPAAQEAKKSFFRWKVLAAICALSFTVFVLMIKQATRLGFSSGQINLFVFGFNFLAFTALSRRELKHYCQDRIKLKTFLPMIFLAATFCFFSNLANIKALSIAPNPGYSEAIKNTQILFATLLSVPLVGASLNAWKFLGVIMVSAATIILVI